MEGKAFNSNYQHQNKEINPEGQDCESHSQGSDPYRSFEIE